MELLALIGGGTLVWFVYACIRGWHTSGQRLEQLRKDAEGKPSSWAGSAEQKMLHNSGWTDGPPPY